MRKGYYDEGIKTIMLISYYVEEYYDIMEDSAKTYL
jgi:hypothetical protein